MAMNYFCCYHDYRKKCEKLTDQELGRLFRALMVYSETGEAKELAGRESIAFDFIADDIDKAKKSYAEKCQKNRENRTSTSGEKHWNWKGGITPQNQAARNSKEAHDWRKAVFRRDSFTCQMCGAHGGKLNAHHVKPWAKFPECRFDVDNGITLCVACHKKTHKKRG